MSERKEQIIRIISGIFPEVDTYEHRDQMTLIIPAEKLVEVALVLRNNPETAFDMCVDVTVIDWLKKKTPRFEVVHFLYSLKFKDRVRIKVPVGEKNPHCPSITEVWESANWYEREAFDMYGILFDGHPDLRRFYMPDDYVDKESGEPIYPLRKDFPLGGIPDSLPLPPYPEKYGEVR
jgi:NADH-quinone oxidoreductase subunit C